MQSEIQSEIGLDVCYYSLNNMISPTSTGGGSRFIFAATPEGQVTVGGININVYYGNQSTNDLETIYIQVIATKPYTFSVFCFKESFRTSTGIQRATNFFGYIPVGANSYFVTARVEGGQNAGGDSPLLTIAALASSTPREGYAIGGFNLVKT